MMLGSKPAWARPDIRDGDTAFEGYADQSLEEWHRDHGLLAD